MIVECNNCEALVDAITISQYGYLVKGNTPSGRYVFLKCAKCEEPILVQQENIGNMIEGDIWGESHRLYPKAEYPINPEIPSPIQDALREAFICLKSKAYTATVIMCRKTLEGTCQLKGASEKNLMKSLEKLRDEKLIDERLYDWSNELRLSGNEAAHGVGITFSRTDSQDILDFTYAITEYIFSYREKFEQFRSRRRG